MDERELTTLDLNPSILEATKKVSIFTCKDVLKLSVQEIIKKTGLTESHAEDLTRAASMATLRSRFITASDLRRGDGTDARQFQRLSFGCPLLDSVFKGGLLTGTITEITGESSSGKTQLCLQLAIRAQLPVEDGGLNAEVAYVCTEERFPFRRFEQLVANLKGSSPQYNSIKFGDNVAISHIKSLQHLLMCFRQAVPDLLKRNIKLFILDSVAGVFGGEYEPGECDRRAKDLQALGRELWKLANEHNIAVLCVNQVTAAANCTGYVSSTGNILPALGLVWSNLLTTRVLTTRTERKVSIASDSTVLRSLKVLFSSYLPNSECYYIVSANGVVGIKPPAVQ